MSIDREEAVQAAASVVWNKPLRAVCEDMADAILALPRQVTDEMVERALIAYWSLDELPPPEVMSKLGQRMRVTLEAAMGFS